MEKLITQLQQYVANHLPNYGDGDGRSILDMLYYDPGLFCLLGYFLYIISFVKGFEILSTI